MQLKQPVAIITGSSAGGDHNGAQVIKQAVALRLSIPASRISEFSLDKQKLETVPLYHHNVFFIGQKASNSLFDSLIMADLDPKLRSTNLYFYSHLYHPAKTKEFINLWIENKQPKSELHFYVPNMQSALFAEFKDGTHPEIKVTLAPLVIKSYQEQQAQQHYEVNKDAIDELLQHPIIHVGGSYMNTAGDNVVCTNQDFEKAISSLSLPAGDNAMGIIMHPRALSNCTTELDYFNRLDSIRSALEHKAITFYVPKLDEKATQAKQGFSLASPAINVKEAPPYDGIVWGINHLQCKQQYVSADQYNAFADITKKVIPFALKQDIEQQQYIQIYQQHGGIENAERSLTEAIIKDMHNCFFAEQEY